MRLLFDNRDPEMRTHSAQIELIEPAPSEAGAGADVTLKIKVACAQGCDLHAMPLTVTDPHGAESTVVLLGTEGAADQVADLVLKIPKRAGAHAWCVSLAAQERDAVLHEASPLRISVHARAHDTSLAVWDIPSPVVAGERFEVKAGAKSSADCDLVARKIEIYNETGNVAAGGALSATPFPGTRALYWTAVELVAPTGEGLHNWSARFEAADLDLPHEGTSASFSFMVVPRPEHNLTVEIIEKASRTPIADAEVRLGPFRGKSGVDGAASIAVPTGIFDLHLWKVGYDAPALKVEVTMDLTVRIEAEIVPEENPDAIWKM